MPSGKVHASVTLATAALAGPLLAALGRAPLQHAAAFSLGCLAGLLVNPDLDVEQGSRSISVMRRSTGCLGAALWYLFWWPYAWMIPHRSPLSHFPVLGTLIRVAYLLGIPMLIYWALLGAVPQIPQPSAGFIPYLLWALLGLIVVDALHALMDWW